jgi:excisionase family DNA binding protein
MWADHAIGAERKEASVDRLLLRVEEAAEQLSMGRSKTYQLVRSGQLPGVIRLGKSLRISAEALRQWIEEQAAGSSADSKLAD